MAHYNKGANAERELIKALFDLGFAVLRVAGSGVNPLPCPDVVAIKNGRIFAIECKAWKGNYLAIPLQNITEEKKWADVAGAEFYIAWKIPRQGWLFVKLDAMHNAGKNYMISIDEAKRQAISEELLFGARLKQPSE